MQAKGREGASEDMAHAFNNIYRQEGLRGLWRVGTYVGTEN